jgi:Mn-dependent DtxR family transcriptional regulator
MKKNQDRKRAETLFLTERGRVTNKELSRQLGVHPATVARWKKLDEWDLKLVQSVTTPGPTQAEQEDDHGVDLRHLRLLNERIDLYLRKAELLPSEIRELAEAKFNIMSCMEIIHDRMMFPDMDDIEDEDDSLD